MSKTVKLPDEIHDLSDFDESINMLVYGPSGCGKSVLGGSTENVLFIAIEKGTVSAKRIRGKYKGKNVKIWPVTEWQDLEDAYVWLLETPDHGFDWIVIDSVTQMQQIAIRDILKAENRKNSSRDLDIPAIQDHQKWQNIFKRFIGYFVELPVNTLFIALARTALDDDKNEFLTPDIQGKNYQLSQYVAGQMSCYGYMSNRKVAMKDEEGNDVLDTAGKKVPEIVRRITWMDTGTIRGKDRYQVLEPFTEDLTLRELTDLIDGEKTREELDQWVRKYAKKSQDPDSDIKKLPAANKAEVKAEAEKSKARAKAKPKEEPKPEPEPEEKVDEGFGEEEAVAETKKSEEENADTKVADAKSDGDDEFNVDGDDDFDWESD